MAITRRQFVTRLGALATAAGFSQVEASKIMEAMAYDSSTSPYGGKWGKPRVVWLHGAECTGCSTSLLGIYEDTAGEAVYKSGKKTAQAALDATILPVGNGLVGATNDFTLTHNSLSPDQAGSMNIADVVIDVIDLLYHETVMGMGGDTAHVWLSTFFDQNKIAGLPYVLVVEGALQDTASKGAWGDTSAKNVPWCSITHADDPTGAELSTGDVVLKFATDPLCVAVIAIGQCATFGGYPGCKPQVTKAQAGGFDPTLSQTDAMGTSAYLHAQGASETVKNKVFNVPGCPTNPWWFVLSVVLFLVDAPGLLSASPGDVGTLGTLRKYQITDENAAFYANPAENALAIGPNGSAAVDGNRRLKAVYGVPVHSSACPRFPWYAKGIFAAKPGDPGCLQRIGCKGMAASSLCGVHGWNAQQPTNDATWASALAQVNPNVQPDGTTLKGYKGGHCTRAGHPCMACTEAGYPDNFVPFIVRS